jgi:hypothetical protein
LEVVCRSRYKLLPVKSFKIPRKSYHDFHRPISYANSVLLNYHLTRYFLHDSSLHQFGMDEFELPSLLTLLLQVFLDHRPRVSKCGGHRLFDRSLLFLHKFVLLIFVVPLPHSRITSKHPHHLKLFLIYLHQKAYTQLLDFYSRMCITHQKHPFQVVHFS